MGIRYGVGTYILREEAQRDLFGVLTKLKQIGYDGVELLGFFGKKPADIRKKLDELSLVALGDHVEFDAFLTEPDRVIEGHLEVGCEYLTIAHREGQFAPGTGEYETMLEGMRALMEKCRKAGITAQYHNHGWDVKGSPSYVDALMERLKEDGLCLEPDLGWMVYSGADPADYLARYRENCQVLHLKDVYAQDYSAVTKQPGSIKREADNGGFEFRPTGYGTVNFPRLMPLCFACDPSWMVVDHDLAYERDAYGDLRLSLAYVRDMVAIAR